MMVVRQSQERYSQPDDRRRRHHHQDKYKRSIHLIEVEKNGIAVLVHVFQAAKET
jgi:hypothetical protein